MFLIFMRSAYSLQKEIHNEIIWWTKEGYTSPATSGLNFSNITENFALTSNYKIVLLKMFRNGIF